MEEACEAHVELAKRREDAAKLVVEAAALVSTQSSTFNLQYKIGALEPLA